MIVQNKRRSECKKTERKTDRKIVNKRYSLIKTAFLKKLVLAMKLTIFCSLIQSTNKSAGVDYSKFQHQYNQSMGSTLTAVHNSLHSTHTMIK